MTRNLLNLPTLEEAIEVCGPPDTWDGECYAVATQLVEAGLVVGETRYGHWIGPIHELSSFAGRREAGFTHHGWIELPDERICDPTRWVFEHKRPYIYVGPNDHYDAGGNRLREKMMRPPPENNVEGARHKFPRIQRVLEWLGPPPYSWGQLGWLANLPLPRLGEDAKRVYNAIIKTGFPGLIPIDNRELVLGKPKKGRN